MSSSRDESEVRFFVGVLSAVFVTGLAGSLFRAHEPAIITAAVILAVLGIAARVLAWRVREYRADRVDAVAAAAARAAYLAGRHPKSAANGSVRVAAPSAREVA